MIHETVTPSGVSIAFEDGEPDPATGKAKRRQYLVNGEKLPSVTTVLGILDKPGLMYAAEKLAVQGALQLAEDGALPQTVEGALARMKSRELRFWQVWGAKADRGTVTHEELVALATGGALADLDSVAPDQREFLQGAADWFADHRPEVIEQEVMVASIEHGFAGRHDFFGRVPALGEGTFLVDYKTTEKLPRYKDGQVKAPYPEHLAQLAGYQIARRECDYEVADFQVVVRIDSTGAHDTTISWVDERVFLAVLEAYKAVKGIGASRPKRVAA